MKNIIAEMRNTLDGINNRPAEDQISYLENKLTENTQSEQQKGKESKQKEDTFQDL